MLRLIHRFRKSPLRHPQDQFRIIQMHILAILLLICGPALIVGNRNRNSHSDDLSNDSIHLNEDLDRPSYYRRSLNDLNDRNARNADSNYDNNNELTVSSDSSDSSSSSETA